MGLWFPSVKEMLYLPRDGDETRSYGIDPYHCCHQVVCTWHWKVHVRSIRDEVQHKLRCSYKSVVIDLRISNTRQQILVEYIIDMKIVLIPREQFHHLLLLVSRERRSI
jgi:hypothetical protein